MAEPLRRSLLVALIVVASAGAGCHEEGGRPLWSLTPALAFANDVLHLGTVYAGYGRSAHVLLENHGGAPARIEAVAVNGASGPAVARATLDEEVVTAGGDVVLALRVTASATGTGVFSAEVAVTHDGGEALVLPFFVQVMPPPPCDDGNPCTLDSFDGEGCRIDVVADGSPCDDDDVCTESTVCQAGVCVGAPLSCDDGVDCTLDVCDPQLGCRAEPLHERCADDDPCTDDVCAPLGGPEPAGCSNATSADGAVCEQDGCSTLGLCFAGTCQVGPVPDGFPCDDGDTCSFGETCQAGVCRGGSEGAMGGAEPVVLAEGGVHFDPCLVIAGGCGAFILGTFDEILTAYELADGRLAAMWRTGYASSYTGETCVPVAEEVAQATILRNVDGALPPAPPVDNGDGDEGADAPGGGAALPEVCAAGVFVTVVDDGTSTTTQVAASDGPAAATFFETSQGDVVLALAVTDESQLRYIEQGLDDPDGPLSRSLWLWRGSFAVEGGHSPIRRLAIDAHAHGAVVVAHPAIRQSSICTSICDAPSCCDTYLEGWDIPGAGLGLFPEEETMPWTVYVPEQYDASCQPFDVAFGGGHAFASRDLAVRLEEGGTDLEITALLNAWPCGDAPGGATDPENPQAGLSPYLFARSAAAGGFVGYTPLLPSELEGAATVMHLRPSKHGEPVTAVVSVPVCPSDADPMNPVIEPDEDLLCGTTIARLAAAPSATVVDTLGGLPEGFGPVDALPLAIGDLRPVAGRAGSELDVRWRTDAGLEVRAPVGLPSGSTWRLDRSFVSSATHVVGIASVSVDTTAEDCCGPPAPCDCVCDGEPDCECACAETPCSCTPLSGTVPRLTAQPFACLPPAPDAAGP